MAHAKAFLDCRKRFTNNLDNGAILEELKSHENVLQVVDTTLLKCYLQVVLAQTFIRSLSS